MPPDLGPAVAVAAGDQHTCAVKVSGELVCFGRNDHGQCDVPPDLGPVVAVAAGWQHTCAVTVSGQLVCFGEKGKGLCGVPSDSQVQFALPPTRGMPVPNPEEGLEVVQRVNHLEPAADIAEEEGAAIVA